MEDRMKFEEIRVKYAILKEFLGVKSDTVYLTSARELKAVIASVEEDFDNLINDMYQGLLFQTRLRPYWEAMNLIVDENTLSAHWDFSAAEALFRSKWGEDSLNAAVDLGEFLQSLQWMEGFSLLGDWVAVAQSQGVADEYLALLGEGGFAMDYQTLDSAGTLKGSAKNDILQGSDADDRLEAGDGDDVLNAADGNDRIYGGNGSDIILGGRGNDHIEDGDGDDTVDAGEGADYIQGGKGSDTYVFKGDFGKDTIYNYSSGAEDVDTVEIQGRNCDEFRFTRYNDDLYITDKNNPENQIQVDYFFRNDGNTSYAIEQIKFADQTLDIAAVKASVGWATCCPRYNVPKNTAMISPPSSPRRRFAVGRPALTSAAKAALWLFRLRSTLSCTARQCGLRGRSDVVTLRPCAP